MQACWSPFGDVNRQRLVADQLIATALIRHRTRCDARDAALPSSREEATPRRRDGRRVRADVGGGLRVNDRAYDEAGARAIRSAAVPDGLPTTSGAPTGFGIYGDVEDVDLADHVVGLWSSGQSGSCPGWLGSVDSNSGTVTLVQVEDLQGFDLCTDDYNAYSQVVVLNRGQVPPPETLPVDGQLTFAMVTDAVPLPGSGPTLRAVITPFTE